MHLHQSGWFRFWAAGSKHFDEKLGKYIMADRQNELKDWLKQILEGKSFFLSPLAGDASFRRYFRVHYENRTEIVMDAPPEKESIQSFIEVASLLQKGGIRIPKILAINREKGFLLLEDFGNVLFLNVCKTLQQPNSLRRTKEPLKSAPDLYYQEAMLLILGMQKNISLDLSPKLPIFDAAFILKELELFKIWFLKAYLNLDLDQKEEKDLAQFFELLAQSIDSQPKRFIHRDYHSRNLMLLDQPLSEENSLSLGLIDFQDAMQGPFLYDLVSLLKDCYVQWPLAKLAEWLGFFYQQAGLEGKLSFPCFEEYFHLCGLQRHLKVLGIFSRLYLRDQKENYLKDLPLTLDYVWTALTFFIQKQSDPVFKNFYDWMQKRVKLP